MSRASTHHAPPSPEEIEQYLEENNLLIEAILQNQNLGRLHECVPYQLQLQQNLIYLATFADQHPGLQPLVLEQQSCAQADTPAHAGTADLRKEGNVNLSNSNG
mmetsp:Transcript_54666/g.125895  ORF Transcript_54666/g.125895 Transcript_54666/m.125895 type:complete len:104 (-) Transcript_54666:262-573(-)